MRDSEAELRTSALGDPEGIGDWGGFGRGGRRGGRHGCAWQRRLLGHGAP